MGLFSLQESSTKELLSNWVGVVGVTLYEVMGYVHVVTASHAHGVWMVRGRTYASPPLLFVFLQLQWGRRHDTAVPCQEKMRVQTETAIITWWSVVL